MERQLTIRNLRDVVARYAFVNWAMADQALLSGVNFLTTVLIANALGLSNFGIFTMAWFVVLLIYSFQFALISAPMLSLAPQQPTLNLPGYFGVVWMQSAVFSIASFLAVLFCAILLFSVYPSAGPISLALPVAAAVAAHQLRDFVRRYFFARGRPAAAFTFNFVLFGSQSAVIFILAISDRLSVESALWSIALISLLAVAVALFFLGQIAWDGAHFRSILRRHWKFSRWLGGSAFLDMFSAQFALIASGAILGTTAVGALKAAQTLMGLAQLMLFASQNIVPRRAGRHLIDGGTSALRRYILRVATVMVGLTLVLAIIFSAASEFWMTFVFRKEFAEYHQLIWWFGLLFIVRAFGFAAVSGLWAIERTQPIFKAYIIGTVVAVALTFPMLDTFGVAGAAATALIVECTLVGIIGVYFWRLSRTAVPKTLEQRQAEDHPDS